MGETASSNAALQVSVSFGRFENDSLSWEKWSSFSPNKYLEEVEKCATPGSVAEKRAYFEAHYKKIAARKAELMEQEKRMETALSRPDARHEQGDLNRNAVGADHEINESARGMEQVNLDGRMEKEIEPNEDDLITIECDSFSAVSERVQEEPHKSEDTSNFDSPVEENVLPEEVQEERQKSEDRPDFEKSEEGNVLKEVQEQEVIPTITVAAVSESQSQPQEDASECGESANEEVGSKTVLQEEKAQSNSRRNVNKMIRLSRERNPPNTRKKPASPLPKTPQITTPKVSKPISASTTSSASRSSTRVTTAQSVQRRKNLNPPSMDRSKKVARKPLQMPVTPSPTSSPASASTMTRKSLIMESMGDKDIVKRAFKMFQNNVRESDLPGDDKSPIPKQVVVPSRRMELRASHSNVTRKENGGARSVATPQTVPTASPPSFGLRSSEKPRASPQQVKKFQEKPNAKRLEEMNPKLKPEVDKEAAHKARQGCNHKAMSGPASDSWVKIKNRPGKGGFQG